ncbi:hypothetical protein, partial [Nocardia brasiliensis]|uniref:hypothetical protein n=1 Tax=Nocardia brasiliensis TaxID=37326 RepID=UPI0024569DC5
MKFRYSGLRPGSWPGPPPPPPPAAPPPGRAARPPPGHGDRERAEPQGGRGVVDAEVLAHLQR